MRLEGILGRIVERTLLDVEARVRTVSRADLEDAARLRKRSRRGFASALRRPAAEDPVRFICEVKKASPSKGVLRADMNPEAVAAGYGGHGASAISVVTEPHFFQGDPDFLRQARLGAPETPLLRKDFHVHELQILETAATEADALLLLAVALDPLQLKDYREMADGLGLEHLVEVDTPRQAEAALKAGARVIGVNNRDLTTFKVDVARTERVLPVFRGTNTVSVAESGIHDRDTVLRLERAGVHALLVGESLVRSPNPAEKLLELRGATAG